MILIFCEDVNSYIEKGTKALQCYAHRGVVSCQFEVTKKMVGGDINVDELDRNVYGVDYPNTLGGFGVGSTGGSILVEDGLFKEVGGYDPELFRAYSAEDQFFWNKLLTKVEIEYADEPAIELFHMWHERQIGNNPHLHIMENYMTNFKTLSNEDKLKVVEHKKNILEDIIKDNE